MHITKFLIKYPFALYRQPLMAAETAIAPVGTPTNKLHRQYTTKRQNDVSISQINHKQKF